LIRCEIYQVGSQNQLHEKSAGGRLIDQGVLGGTLKSTRYMLQKSRGVLFEEKKTAAGS